MKESLKAQLVADFTGKTVLKQFLAVFGLCFIALF